MDIFHIFFNQYTTPRKILNTQVTSGFFTKKDLDNSAAFSVSFLHEYYPRHAPSSPPTPSALIVRACLVFFIQAAMRPFCCLAAHNWDPNMTIFNNKNIARTALPIALYASNLDAKSIAEMANSAWTTFPWEKRDAPRRECFYSSLGKSYTYGSGRGERTYIPVPYSSLVKEWTNEVESFLDTAFELCFANGYESEKEHLGWHADDSPEVDDNRPIAVLSLGAEREIWVRPRGGDFSTVEKFVLPSGSLFIMNAGMQDTHDHRIPKADRACGYRVSLTWRGAA